MKQTKIMSFLSRSMKVSFIFLFLLSSCITSSIQKLNPTTYYINDICFSYGEDYQKTICGVGVLPYQEEYDIQIDSFSKLNFFTMMTCHREITTENPDKGIFKKNGRTRIDYKPTIENGKACPLYIAVYNKKGRHAWGMLVFEHPRFKLKSTTKCNGEIRINNGVSICQARSSLLQEIIFDEEVIAARPVNGAAADRKADCPPLTTADNKRFEFVMPERECIYGFVSKKDKKLHKFYTVGYEELIVRD